MEKIKVNYDLLRRIKESKTGMRLHRIKCKLIFLSFASSFVLIPNFAMLISKPEHIKSFASSLGNVIWIIGVNILMDYIFEKKNKDNNILNAEEDLRNLVIKLVSMDVRTTLELLKESKVIDTHYEIKFNDNMLPVLKQEKYIKVPLSNGYEEGEILLQEHNIGSRDYELSVFEPVKEYKYKTSKASI